MTDFLVALGLVLVFEGIVFAAGPGAAKQAMASVLETPDSVLRIVGKGLVRPAGVPVVMQWGSHLATLRSGPDPVVVSGLPSEVALLLHGRSEHTGVELTGPPEHVARLRGADLGI